MLDVKRNHVSLSIPDSEGLHYNSRGGVLKFIKGSLVVMKGTKINGLYTLQCQTIGKIGLYLTISEARIELWYRRMVHISGVFNFIYLFICGVNN